MSTEPKIGRLKLIQMTPPPLISESEYWATKAARGSALRPLGKPCHDCAVVCDFYSERSDALALQPEPIRIAASLRWFCHNHPNRACRGNIDRLAVLNRVGGGGGSGGEDV